MANFALLREAYAFLQTIPDPALDLRRIVNRMPNKQPDDVPDGSCGAIACGLGWLAMHPKFKKKGLALPAVCLNGTVGALLLYRRESMHFEYAAAGLFDIPKEDAAALFTDATDNRSYGGVMRSAEYPTDKEILLARLRQYLSDNGELS